MKRTLIVVGLLIVAVLIWRWAGVRDESSGLRPGEPSAASPASTTPPPRAGNPPTDADRVAPPERSSLADALNSPKQDIRADLRLVADILDTFRTNFPRNGNPVGSNAEVTAALTGQNRLRLALIPSDHPAINRSGELCDRWGTPFFFHAESANKMSIRSAGPDRKMWNDDDVELTP